MLSVSWPALAQSGSPPARPAKPTADSVAHDSVTISWADPDDSSITGYQVLRRNRDTDDPGVFTVIEDDTGTADTFYTDSSVEPETRYVYRVKARNSYGLSNRSGYLSVDTPEEPVLTPAKPAKPTADSVAHDSVTISWADPDDSSITGYQVLRRNRDTDDPGVFTVIEDDTGTADTFYTDSSVEPETRYVYRVKARNSYGLSNRSGYLSVDTPEEPVLTPAKPAKPTADSVAHDSVTISWADPDDSSITGYQVLRRNRDTDDPGVFTVIEDDTGTADTFYTDSSVEPETRYVYRVRARNSYGLSNRSGYLSVDTPEEPVNRAPSGLPTITGTVQVGETLAADTSGISDGNGLTNAQYAYQWVRNDDSTDTDISGATGSTYTLRDADLN